jgi:phage gp46-like protein
LYDVSNTLGSTLYLVPRSPSLAQIGEAQAAVVEALAPMTEEIEINSVVAEKTPENTLQLNIGFTPILTDPDVPTIAADLAPEIDAISVTILPPD